MMTLQENSFAGFMHSILTRWKEAFNERRFMAWMTIVLLYLTVLLLFLSYFLPYIDHRPGRQLRNLWIEYLPAYDLSAAIFALIYISMAVTLVYTLNKPKLFLRWLAAMGIMYSIRCITLYFVPLEPPAGYIPLADPLVQWLARDQEIAGKDLFFSGHTAFLFICILVVRKRYLEIGLCVALIAVVVMLVFQHAHYFMDLAAAFLITPICWVASGKILPFSYPLATQNGEPA